MDFFEVVEWTTIVVTFGMMLSGIPPCVTMYRKKETKNVPLPFFLVCLVNSLTGFFYGLLNNNFVLKLMNSVGGSLWGIYSLVFIYVSRNKTPPTMKLLGMLAVFAAQIAYQVYVVQDQQRMLVNLGSLLFFWSNIMVLTPVLEIMEVVKTKSSDGVPVSLLMGGLMCSSAWMTYGYLLSDINIYGPNIVGTIVNFIRLGLLIAYRGGSKLKSQ